MKNGEIVSTAGMRRSKQTQLGHSYAIVYAEHDSEDVSDESERKILQTILKHSRTVTGTPKKYCVVSGLNSDRESGGEESSVCRYIEEHEDNKLITQNTPSNKLLPAGGAEGGGAGYARLPAMYHVVLMSVLSCHQLLFISLRRSSSPPSPQL